MRALVTGARGFIGSNLVAWLERVPGVEVQGIDLPHSKAQLAAALATADVVYHLAGVNRPADETEFKAGNVGSTATVCERLLARERPIPLVLSSSVQATMDNPYGVSKREAEEVAAQYARSAGARVAVFRLRNVFGKWCRPEYNSVVATFCHHIARDEPITINDPGRSLELVYIDDVVAHLLEEVGESQGGSVVYREVTPVYEVTLGALAAALRSFRETRSTGGTPDFSEPWVAKLYATYLSHLPPDNLAYGLTQKEDARGVLAEVARSGAFGQIFVSRTRPRATRGGHFHHTKVEKFLVVEGEAVIRFRQVVSPDVFEYRVRGEELRVVDIPPGYTHSIQNVGTGELVTLFWASEAFDAAHPDTWALPVGPVTQ